MKTKKEEIATKAALSASLSNKKPEFLVAPKNEKAYRDDYESVCSDFGYDLIFADVPEMAVC